MSWLLGASLALLSMPFVVGFVQGFVEALRRPRPRLRVIFMDDEE